MGELGKPSAVCSVFALPGMGFFDLVSGAGRRVVGWRALPATGVCFECVFIYLLPDFLPFTLSPGIRAQVIRHEVMGHLLFSPLAPAMGSWRHQGAPESRLLMEPILVPPAGLSVCRPVPGSQTVRQTRLPLTLFLSDGLTVSITESSCVWSLR